MGTSAVITILISHQKHYCHRNHQHIFSECHGGKRDRKHVPHAWTCNVETATQPENDTDGPECENYYGRNVGGCRPKECKIGKAERELTKG
jgi:hypothetical protein